MARLLPGLFISVIITKYILRKQRQTRPRSKARRGNTIQMKFSAEVFGSWNRIVWKYVLKNVCFFTTITLQVQNEKYKNMDLFSFENKNGFCFDSLVTNAVVLITHHGVYNWLILQLALMSASVVGVHRQHNSSISVQPCVQHTAFSAADIFQPVIQTDFSQLLMGWQQLSPAGLQSQPGQQRAGLVFELCVLYFFLLLFFFSFSD